MANATTLQILEDGARQTVVKFDGVLDTSDLASMTVLDPTAQFIDPINPTTQYRIDNLEWSISDPIVIRLSWDATSPVKIVEMAGRGGFLIGEVYGGFQNNAGAGKTGKITALSTGYSAGTVAFTILIRAVKQ
jgi:hypothetical protein